MVEYKLKGGMVLKDGHTMFLEDIVKDLKRKAYLEDPKEKEADSSVPFSAGVRARAFAGEFHGKFMRRAAERNRSLTPWVDFEFIELFERLQEETSELYEAAMEKKDMEAVMDECKDVANFAWFIYEQARFKLEQAP